MYIKQLTISNFRSFRQQPEIHPFSPTTNCVVGRNGSGKSNYFDAVQFVLLSPRFYTLRTEERQALLHEGAGSAAVNAFVEIVFDNSDHRFALEASDEVVLRRTVGLKKDEFFLQRKRATKTEVASLLEGAGFSKSNPYYLVPQGKIQGLCTMKDSDRLELLQQVAGTTVYDDKKVESLAKMRDNEQSITKITDILQELDAKLQELHGEKEELTNYQRLDKDRKAMEYTLYDLELKKARHTLDQLEKDRNESYDTLCDCHDNLRHIQESIQNAEAAVQVQKQAVRRNRLAITTLEADKTQAVTIQSKCKLQTQELQELIQQEEERMEQEKQELKRIETEIGKAEASLQQTIAQYQQERAEHETLIRDRDAAQQTLDGLYAKQGRGQKFQTKRQRDASLRQIISQDIQPQIDAKEALLTKSQDTLAKVRRQITTAAQQEQTTQEDLAQKQAAFQTMTKTLEEKKRVRVELTDVRKAAWRQAEQLQDQVRDAQQAYEKARSDLRKVTPRATGLGLNALERLVVQERLVRGQQYFGTVMENMTVTNPKYETAVEVAAQNALFHVIVDTDTTAARLVQRLEQGQLGRVTFLPLNRLRTPPSEIQATSNDVQPLLDICVEYNPQLEKAFRHVFDKKWLARNGQIAADFAARHQVDAITLEGDLCSRKGALSGGYVDRSKSRLLAHIQQQQAKETLTKIDAEYQQQQDAAHEEEQKVNQAMQEHQKLSKKHSQLERKLRELELKLKQHKDQQKRHENQVERLEQETIPTLERELETLRSEVQRLNEEMGTELVTTLTDEDRAQMAQLKVTIAELKTKVQSQQETVDYWRNNRQKVQSLLDDNLYKRKNELTHVQEPDDDDNDDDNDNIGGSESSSSRRRSRAGGATTEMLQAQRVQELEDLKVQVEDANRVVDEIESRLEEAREKEKKLNTELLAAKNEVERLKSSEMKTSKELEEAQQRSEELMSKRAIWIGRREEYMRKIQELGSLPPPSELEKYKDKSINRLTGMVEKVNKQLSKYSHVNKKAFDQYVNFSEQRESLLKRKEELDRGAEKVKELVESLDRQKDEAINRTFRGVSAHFQDVFKELVPNGAGELIMRTAMDDIQMQSQETDSEGDDDSDGDGGGTQGSSSKSSKKKKKAFDPENPDVSLYRGIGIKVRFSTYGENFIMSQLSGGQKALVALALIFAIQRCDPAPFYIFDELDQALDSTYRAAVANLIKKQANSPENPTQFITSTFRPELVSVAANCYGVSHQNKVSTVHPLSKKDALRFIADLMNEEEAVGEVTTLGTSRSTGSQRKRKAQEDIAGEEEEDDEDDGGGGGDIPSQESEE